MGKDGIGTRGKIPVLVHSFSVGSSYESITNYRKPVATHKSIHFVASSKSCKIEGRQPRPLADRPFHPLCFVGLASRNRNPSSTAWNCVKVLTGGQLAKRVRRLLDSLHRGIRALVQAEGCHMSHWRRYYYIASPANYSRINPYVDIPIWSFPLAGDKSANFCLIFSLIW